MASRPLLNRAKSARPAAGLNESGCATRREEVGGAVIERCGGRGGGVLGRRRVEGGE